MAPQTLSWSLVVVADDTNFSLIMFQAFQKAPKSTFAGLPLSLLSSAVTVSMAGRLLNPAEKPTAKEIPMTKMAITMRRICFDQKFFIPLVKIGSVCCEATLAKFKLN